MPLAAFASDDVDGVRRQVLGHLYAVTGEHASCEVDVPEPLALPFDIATPLALTVNEAVANAFNLNTRRPCGRRIVPDPSPPAALCRWP